MRRRTLFGGGGNTSEAIIPEGQYTAGNLVLYDKTNDKKIVVDTQKIIANESLIADFPSSAYTPIAVIVVPSAHDMYGNGKAGAISLVDMSCKTPETGCDSSTSEKMCYGRSLMTEAITNLYKDGTTWMTILESMLTVPSAPIKNSWLPCQENADFCNKWWDEGLIDPLVAYYYHDSTHNTAPSPYAADGMSSNKDNYFAIKDTTNGSRNALRDFDGLYKTQIAMTVRDVPDGDDWILDPTDTYYLPAFSCCNMFHTEGTSQGDWYLPGAGEFGYVLARRDFIEDAVAVVNALFSSTNATMLSLDAYITATECDSSLFRAVSIVNGGVTRDSMAQPDYYVRAFIQIP